MTKSGNGAPSPVVTLAADIVRCAAELAQLQLRLAHLFLNSIAGEGQATDERRPSRRPISDAEIDAAARLLEQRLLQHRDIGFAAMLRANFPRDDIRRMAAAALEAAQTEAIGGGEPSS